MSEVRSLYHHEPSWRKGLVLASSTPAALQARARMILLAVEGLPPWEIAERLDCTVATVRQWIQRFNREGMLGSFDRPRSGAPRQHPVGEVPPVIEAATTRPDEPGLPFSSWTLAKLRRYLREKLGIVLSRFRAAPIARPPWPLLEKGEKLAAK